MINPDDNLVLQGFKNLDLLPNGIKKFEIYLDKKIPIGAGLGGGSADAAAMLILLRKLYNKEKDFDKISISNIV